MKEFEYKVAEIQIQLNTGMSFHEAMAEKLNCLGKNGWELAGVQGTVFYFKREIIK